MTRTALVAGGSGLVGGHLLTALLADEHWDLVISIGRRRLELRHPRLVEHLVDFTDLDVPDGVTDAFSCLGTTIRKAGSQAAFRAVDHGAVLSVAHAARRAGATGFWHVTALGADPSSRIFYNRVKGETERDVAALGFQRYAAFRPSMLDGERLERRPAERIGLVAMRAVGPLLGRYRPTAVDDVARAMVACARSTERCPGPVDHVVEATDISRLASA